MASCAITSNVTGWTISLDQMEGRLTLENTFFVDSVVNFDVKVFLNNCYGREEVAPGSLDQTLDFVHNQVIIEDQDGILRTFSTLLFCRGEIKSMSNDDCTSIAPEVIKIEPSHSEDFSIPIYYISDIMSTCSSTKVRLHYYSVASKKIELTSNWITVNR